MKKLTCADWVMIVLILILVFVGMAVVAYSQEDGAIWWVTPSGKIQDAIDRASNGDLVLVQPGTYYENIDFKGKAIFVQGNGGASNTVIDGGRYTPAPDPEDPSFGCVVRFISGEGPESVLQGFTITNGVGLWWEYGSWEEGEYVEKIYSRGAGIYGWGSGATIRNCHIVDNNTYSNHPGSWHQEVVAGGAMHFGNYWLDAPITWSLPEMQYYDVVVEGCTIEDNASGERAPGCRFKGIRSLTFKNNIVKDNHMKGLYKVSSPGLALAVYASGRDPDGDAHIHISGNRFYANNASEYAIEYPDNVVRLQSNNHEYASLTTDIYNNVIADNQRLGGLYCSGGNTTNIHHNTIYTDYWTWGASGKALNVGNDGTFYYTQVHVHNNIIWHEAQMFSHIVRFFGKADVWWSHNCWNYSPTGFHNIIWYNLYDMNAFHPDWVNVVNDNPLLVDPGPYGNYDYHLTSASPCIEQGLGGLCTVDFEGDERNKVNCSDIGADELVNE